MKWTTYQQGLIAATKAAVHSSAKALKDARPGDPLRAYSLLTEDGLTCLGHLAATESVLAVRSEESAFVPVDWPFDDGVEAFDPARKLMVAHYQAGDTDEAFHQHVDDSFAALVQAMVEAQREGAFPEGIFLDVASTDPSDHLEELEGLAVIALNQPTVAEQFRRIRLA